MRRYCLLRNDHGDTTVRILSTDFGLENPRNIYRWKGVEDCYWRIVGVFEFYLGEVNEPRGPSGSCKCKYYTDFSGSKVEVLER